MDGRKLFGALLIILGILGIICGVLYLTMSAHALPSFLPGHSASVHALGKHTKRGIAALVVGVVLGIIGIAAVGGGRRRRSRYRF